MMRGQVAAALAIVDIGAYAILGGVGLSTLGPDLADPVSEAMFGCAVAAFSVMGALLIRRVPGNRIGTLLLGTGTAQVVGLGLQLYGRLGGSGPSAWPGAAICLALTDVWFIAPFVIALIGVPLVFPDGRLPFPRFRWVVGVTVAGIFAMVLGAVTPEIHGLPDPEPVASGLVALSVAAIFFGFGGAATAIWVRFRRGGPVQRQQVKWLLADAAVAVIAFPVAMVFAASGSLVDLGFWLAGFLAYLALPITIGLAILRYRLYEIDRLISRTIGYAIVTGTLAVVFAGAILLFQSLLAPFTGGSTVPVAASTLVVAALFQPLGRGVQNVVDRRFNRARYHAAQTAAAFASQLRDEVDVTILRADVLSVVTRTIAPAVTGLWIRSSDGEP